MCNRHLRGALVGGPAECLRFTDIQHARSSNCWGTLSEATMIQIPKDHEYVYNIYIYMFIYIYLYICFYIYPYRCRVGCKAWLQTIDPSSWEVMRAEGRQGVMESNEGSSPTKLR